MNERMPKCMMADLEDDPQALDIETLCSLDPEWFCAWWKLKAIWCLLANKRFGLKEIKREIKEIEEKLDRTVPVAGALSTGPFLVRAGENNAINVKVQNIGQTPIDATVLLVNVGNCPPQVVDSETLSAIGGGCCTENAVLTASAGDFEVIICPNPINAPIRAFVSVHSGNSVTSAFEYVIRASEMIAPACDFCTSVVDGVRSSCQYSNRSVPT